MSFLSRTLGEGFGRRLCASLGAKEDFRIEKWICVGRIAMAMGCYAWTQVYATYPLHPLWHVEAIINTYLLYSFLILVLLHFHGVADLSYRWTTLIVDLVFATTITLFSGGPESPYGVLWVFVIVETTYRWSVRETNFTAAACALLLLAETIAIGRWPRYFYDSADAETGIERLLLRGTFLVAIGLLPGYLAIRERRQHAETALIARMFQRTHTSSGVDRAFEVLFEEIVRLYTPLQAIVALRKENAEEVFAWEEGHPVGKQQGGRVRNVLQFSRLEAAAFAVPAHAWYFKRNMRRPIRAIKILAFDSFGRKLSCESSAELQLCLPANEVPTLMVSSFEFENGWTGRLILVGAAVSYETKRALRVLLSLTKKLSPVVQNICSAGEFHAKVEDQVRAQFTRELHDGTLQSLLSAEMQIEVLRRQILNSPNVLAQRLTGLQSLIHQEALNLRDLIEGTKPLNFGPGELPDFLAELVARFRRESGISVRLEIKQAGRNLPPKVCHEILRIVQEGLSNVRKHSGARSVVVTLSQGDNGQHKLLIADDGQGFGFRGVVSQGQLEASHRGPSVIKERVRQIGGELTIDSSPGHGARLEITIPDQAHG